MPTRPPIVVRTVDTSAQVVHLAGRHELSPRGRRLALVLTLALLLGALAVLSATAGPQLTGATPSASSGAASGNGTTEVAQPAPAAAPGQAQDGAILAEWDGPVVHLDWAGRTYATAAASFVGDRVASPGDRVQRTLRIANAGPSDGVMSVALVAQRGVAVGEPGTDLGESVDLFWDTGGVAGQERFASLVATGKQGRVVSEVAVPHGETVSVTVGFTMPADVTAHQGRVDTGVLEFQVVVRLQGESEPPVPALAVTGAQVAAVVALALGLAALGALLLLLGRRRGRECADCGARLPEDAHCAGCGACACTDLGDADGGRSSVAARTSRSSPGSSW